MPNWSLAYHISAKSRKRKYEQFLKLILPNKEETILDVGVNTEEYSDTDNYLEKFYSFPENITAVGLGDFSEFQKRYPKVRVLQTDGRALPFTENEFSIVYSNAVIEHVGNDTDQVRFLEELYRVSTRGYITTPNRLFPIEVHTRIPLLHILLPKNIFDVVLRSIGKGWAAGDYMNLLSERDLRERLQKAGITSYTVIKNRFFGLPMTFTVVWNKTQVA